MGIVVFALILLVLQTAPEAPLVLEVMVDLFSWLVMPIAAIIVLYWLLVRAVSLGAWLLRKLLGKEIPKTISAVLYGEAFYLVPAPAPRGRFTSYGRPGSPGVPPPPPPPEE